MIKRIAIKLIAIIAIIFVFLAGTYVIQHNSQMRVLNKIIERLSADSRVAEALVTDVRYDPATKKNYTTIKFLEYDTGEAPLSPKFFTFSENIIQFQAMVIRFDDFFVKKAHPLKGKSAYIFMKAFTLKDNSAEVFEINRVNEIPSGYKIKGAAGIFEKKLWERFWQYALDPYWAKRAGVKNAQIEAPGTKFIPGMLYTLKIEHDGGLRIDAKPVPPIFKSTNDRL